MAALFCCFVVFETIYSIFIMVNTHDETKKAVSLQYDDTIHDAPVVTASGGGEFAERIIALAKASNIPIKKDKDLVQLLAALDVSCPIPLEAYTVVAAILSYIYKASSLKD